MISASKTDNPEESPRSWQGFLRGETRIVLQNILKADQAPTAPPCYEVLIYMHESNQELRCKTPLPLAAPQLRCVF